MKRSRLISGWPDDNLDALPVTEVFVRNALHVIEGDFLDLFLPDLIVVIAQTEEFVGGAETTECPGGLIADRLGSQEFGLGPVKLDLCKTVGGELPDLVFELALGKIYLLRIGAEIEDEEIGRASCRERVCQYV